MRMLWRSIPEQHPDDYHDLHDAYNIIISECNIMTIFCIIFHKLRPIVNNKNAMSRIRTWSPKTTKSGPWNREKRSHSGSDRRGGPGRHSTGDCILRCLSMRCCLTPCQEGWPADLEGWSRRVVESARDINGGRPSDNFITNDIRGGQGIRRWPLWSRQMGLWTHF